MSNQLTKTDVNGYFRDEKTGAIINTNYTEYDRFIAQKNQHLEYVKTKKELSELKSEIEELKRLLLERVKDV